MSSKNPYKKTNEKEEILVVGGQNRKKTRYGYGSLLIGSRRRRRCHKDGENEVVCFNGYDAWVPRGGVLLLLLFSHIN